MPNQNHSYKLLKASLLIDGSGKGPIKEAAVLIQGSKITATGFANQVTAPLGASVQIFDYPDKTIMPGMVDCHTHHNGFGDGRAGDDVATLPDEILSLQSARNARASLFSGVTSIRENGPKNQTMFRLRDAINQGITIGPRMILCGRAVSIIGGHMGYFGSETTGLKESRAMTRQLIKEGADYIKITATGGTTKTSFPLLPSFNTDELKAITDEAHKFGKLTATHCTSTQGIINSLDANVDMIIHCVFRNQDGTYEFLNDIADRIGEQGVYVNPTLQVGRASIWNLQHKQQIHKLPDNQKKLLDNNLRSFDTRMEQSARMIDMGLKVITGSDSSWGNYKLGNTVYETECLVMAGYSPIQGLSSVTSEAAKALGIDDKVGTLEAGKEADIIVVKGNPSENITDLWNVEDVFLAGRRVERTSNTSLSNIRQLPVYNNPVGSPYQLAE